MGVVNLYQIFDTEWLEIVADGVTAVEAAALLDVDDICRIARAATVGIKIKRRYRIEAIDRAVPIKSPLWAEWDSVRNSILKLCRPSRKE